ncbi:Serpentine receptor class gamma [Caenorhabditis elegans]|uniref:Serpentine receptor class gamma n=1 Tax=Caenorhabditis elegans TaxID=6239 RepID=H2KZM2_CAEEL|nr:Serpentine receptor class gamma [Caenorhabditis elegans]CCD68896.1 Serpentine receptor class gamma [Caenorhabditis elegans]|eukprot:NP_497313.1 Uncharacterized protein CELE_Y34F4.2 [Caenorhabditis elegans]
MVDLKLCFYGISLLIGFLLHVVGTVSNSIFIYYFKPVWVEKHLANFGIDLGVPYWWGPSAKVAVYTCLLSSIGQNLVVVAYIFLFYESQNHQYSRKFIYLLKFIKYMLLASTLLLIVGLNLLTLSAKWDEEHEFVRYGYSLWLLVASICISPFNILVVRRFEESAEMKQKLTKIYPLTSEIPNDFVVLKSGYSKMSDI